MDIRVPSAALRGVPVGASVPWTAVVADDEIVALYMDGALVEGRIRTSAYRLL